MMEKINESKQQDVVFHSLYIYISKLVYIYIYGLTPRFDGHLVLEGVGGPRKQQDLVSEPPLAWKSLGESVKAVH